MCCPAKLFGRIIPNKERKKAALANSTVTRMKETPEKDEEYGDARRRFPQI